MPSNFGDRRLKCLQSGLDSQVLVSAVNRHMCPARVWSRRCRVNAVRSLALADSLSKVTGERTSTRSARRSCGAAHRPAPVPAPAYSAGKGMSRFVAAAEPGTTGYPSATRTPTVPRAACSTSPGAARSPRTRPASGCCRCARPCAMMPPSRWGSLAGTLVDRHPRKRWTCSKGAPTRDRKESSSGEEKTATRAIPEVEVESEHPRAPPRNERRQSHSA
ncbi:Uncharacterised protein [Nocardia cyriacigeorgica]|uniref:Uncharacterized protein n=1 Tax=Nocardia cyriacigeorgica TaxID=135487 RepID=A0A4U8W268_9NOCA|nr:Uncharacterised protein [Nocardia cyriacigeorgica]